MKKEDFIKLGVDEEMAEKLAEESKKELEGFIPKTRFDEVNDAKKAAEGQVKTLTKDLETAKANVGDNEDLKKQLEDAIQKQKDDAKAFDDQMKELRANNAIKLAIHGKVHDDDMVSGLIDKSKLIISDDGSITGLDEQLKALQESKAFLFKQEEPQPEPQPKPGFFPRSPGEPKPSNDPNHTPTIAEALTARFSQQQK